MSICQLCLILTPILEFRCDEKKHLVEDPNICQADATDENDEFKRNSFQEACSLLFSYYHLSYHFSPQDTGANCLAHPAKNWERN